jgi:beta-phosphoglucomutase family hydrolase
MDGTLLDTMPNHVEAWQKTAEYFDFPFDKEWLHSLGGMPSPKIAHEVSKRYAIELDCLAVSKRKMAFFAQLSAQANPIAVTFDVFKRYTGIKPMAIGTGSQRLSAMDLLKKAGIVDDFQAIVTANEVDNHKPFPDTFLKAAALMAVKPESCVVFEDTQLGLRAAHAAGMDCYLVTNNELKFHPVS